MKRGKLLTLLGSICLILVLAALLLPGCAKEEVAPTPAAPTPEEPIHLTYAEYSSPTHVRNLGGVIPFCEEVYKRTDGRVSFSIHYGGALCSLPETLDVVGAGIADAASSCTSYYPAELPLKQMGSLTFLAPTAIVAAKAWWEMRDTGIWSAFAEELAAYNVIEIFPQPLPSVQLMFSEKRVTTLEELQGLRVRGDAVMLKAWDALGAVPVSISFGEVYGALERGTIDGGQTYIHTVKGFRFYEVIKYWLIGDFGSVASDIPAIMNLDTWNELPPDIQDIILQVGREASLNLANYYGVAVKEEAMELLEGAGVEILELSPEEKARWYDIARPAVMKAFRDAAIEKGCPWDEAFKIYTEAIERLMK